MTSDDVQNSPGYSGMSTAIFDYLRTLPGSVLTDRIRTVLSDSDAYTVTDDGTRSLLSEEAREYLLALLLHELFVGAGLVSSGHRKAVSVDVDSVPFNKIRAIHYDPRLSISRYFRDQLARTTEDNPGRDIFTRLDVYEDVIGELWRAVVHLECKIEGIANPLPE